MTQLKRIAIGLALLVLILLTVAFILPSRVNVVRAIEVNTGESEIYPFLANLEKFNEWSPWAAIDPTIQYAYSGPQIGEGAEMAWQSNDPNVGSGLMKVTHVEEPNAVDIALDFGEQGTGTSQFRLEQIRAGTRVIWRFQTNLGSNPIARWSGVILEHVIGKVYETGLQRLKTRIETGKI